MLCCSVLQASSFFSEASAAAEAAAVYAKHATALARRVAQLPRPVMSSRTDTSICITVDKRGAVSDDRMAVSTGGARTLLCSDGNVCLCIALVCSVTVSWWLCAVCTNTSMALQGWDSASFSTQYTCFVLLLSAPRLQNGVFWSLRTLCDLCGMFVWPACNVPALCPCVCLCCCAGVPPVPA